MCGIICHFTAINERPQFAMICIDVLKHSVKMYDPVPLAVWCAQLNCSWIHAPGDCIVNTGWTLMLSLWAHWIKGSLYLISKLDELVSVPSDTTNVSIGDLSGLAATAIDDVAGVVPLAIPEL